MAKGKRQATKKVSKPVEDKKVEEKEPEPLWQDEDALELFKRLFGALPPRR